VRPDGRLGRVRHGPGRPQPDGGERHHQRPDLIVLLFSPIVYPPSHLPGWLFAIHQVLPFYNLAVVIRAGLSVGLVSDLTQAFAVLAAWTVAGWAMTGRVIGRRR
jgi:ABC-type uncharacterized transport system permease subunit